MTNQELVHRIGRRVKVKPESGIRAFEKPMRVSGVKEGWGELCAILIPDDEIVLTRTQYERKTVDVTASNLERDYQPLTEEQAQQLKPGQKLQLIGSGYAEFERMEDGQVVAFDDDCNYYVRYPDQFELVPHF